MKGGYKDAGAENFYAFYDSELVSTDDLEIKEQTVPVNFGPVSGSAKIYQFDGGAIFCNTMNAAEDYRLVSQSGPLVKIHFCLKGEKTTGIEAEGSKMFVKQNENNLYHFIDCEGYFDFKKGQHIEYVDICLNEDFFNKITGNYAFAFKDLTAAIDEKRFMQISKKPMKTTLKMKAVLADVLKCIPNFQIKKAYFINKLVELMLLQFNGIVHGDSCNETNCICKTPQDFEKLEKARQILLAKLENPPSLLELAKASGINDYKLKKGFKEVYNNTVMGYLTEYKLDLANQMLKNKQHSIAEVCEKLGYKSPSHFSRSFKKTFNINPSAVV